MGVLAPGAIAGRPGRYPILDALRALAILLVLARHWAVAAQDAFGTVPGGPLAVVAHNGWIGVDLFFVLSGFLISSHFAAAPAGGFERGRIIDFYRRRALRTMPLYWGVILLCWLTAPSSGAAPVSVLSFLTHAFFLQDYAGSDVMVTLWSLAVEEKFYLAAPLLLWLLLRCRTGAAAVLLIGVMAWQFRSMLAAAGGVAPGDYPAFFWASRAPFHHAALGILAGAMVALFHARAPAWRAPRLLYAGVGALLLLPLAARDWIGQGDWSAVCGLIALSCALFALLVRCGLGVNAWRPEFGAALPLRYVAKLSYALYLVHYPLIEPAVTLTRALPLAEPTLASLAFLVIFCALSWAAALVLHLAIERPFLRLRDRLPAPGYAAGSSSTRC